MGSPHSTLIDTDTESLMMIKTDTKGVLQSGRIKSRLFVAKILPKYAFQEKAGLRDQIQWNSRNESLVECHYFGV